MTESLKPESLETHRELSTCTLATLLDQTVSDKDQLSKITHIFSEQLLAHDPKLNSQIYFDAGAVSAQIEALAGAYDTFVAAQAECDPLALGALVKERWPLFGIPVLIKDNICVADQPNGCASKILSGWTSPYDAGVIEKLRQAGAILLARSNMDEFGMGSSNENSAFGAVRNPWNPDYVPGGSSGGSAAGVAAGFAPLALGSDTGGSVRQPAAYCGLVGIKPSFGRVSRYGLIAYGSSLDQIGPLAHRVQDAAVLLDVIAGHDSRDETSWRPQRPLRSAAAVIDSKRTYRIGIVSEMAGMEAAATGASISGTGFSPDILAAFKRAQEVFVAKHPNASIEVVSLPSLREAISCYYVIASAEASANLARFDGVRFGARARGDVPENDLDQLYVQSRSQGFGPEVKQRIMLGTFALSSAHFDAFYAKALTVRDRIRREFAEAFSTYDALISPTTPTPAFKLGENTKDPLAMYFNDICTTGANLAELCALSLPMGYTDAGLPMGLQWLCPRFHEETLVALARALEADLLSDGITGRRAPGFGGDKD